MGAQPHGCFQGAAHRAIRRCAAEDRHGKNPVAGTPGKGTRKMKAFLLLLALVAPPAMAQITITDAWARPTPPGADMGAASLTIRKGSRARDKLLQAIPPAAE